MTKHKKNKAIRRKRRVVKEVHTHRNSYRVMHPDEGLTHPKPLSEEEILAQRKPIPKEEKEEQDEQANSES